MTAPWASRFGGAITLVLFATALISLQIAPGGSRLVYELPAYAALALAALVASLAARVFSRAALVCFGATALFAGYVVFRAVTSPSAYHARPDLFSCLAGAVVYGLTSILLPRAGSRMALLTALSAFGLVHVIVCLVQFGIGENFVLFSALEKVEATERPSGLHAGPAYLAGLLEVLGIFCLSFACWSRWPKWGKVVIGYLAAVGYFGVAVTGSRGGYLSVVVSLLVFGLLSVLTLRAGGGSIFWKWSAVALVIALGVGFLAASLLGQSKYLTKRVENIVAPDEGRFDLWRAAVEQWKLEPWTGTGSGTYRFLGRLFRGEKMQDATVAVHNDYLHFLSEYGLLGAALFLLFLAAHLRSGLVTFLRLGPQRVATGAPLLSDRLALNLGALAALAAFVVHSAFDFNMHQPANALLLAFVVALLAHGGLESPADPSRGWTASLPKMALAAAATALLVACVRLFPAEYYAHRARAALEVEAFAEGATYARRAVASDHRHGRAFVHLGHALALLGDDTLRVANRNASYEEALAAFERARQLNPLDGNIPLEMALLYDRLDRFAEAEWMFWLARERDPRSDRLEKLYRRHLRLWRNAGTGN